MSQMRIALSALALFVLATIACSSPLNTDPGPGTGPGWQPRSSAPQIATPPPVGQAPSTTAPRGPAPANPPGDLPAASPMQSTGTEEELIALFERANSGVVSISVATAQGQGAGSGFVIDGTGHIVTNDHVVAGANQVLVTFFNGLQGRADVIGTDDDSDLAVIRVAELPEGVTPLELADSSTVRVGQRAVAIGNPFGLQSTLTVGVISAVGRTIPSLAAGFNIPLAIQTDAPINPGNSGGPLLNGAGQVIGVNSQIQSSSGVSAGIGFAVPSNIVRRVVPVLIEQGGYEWPYLGVQGLPVTLPLAEELNLPVNQGAYVTAVVPGGPADRAGLRGAESQVRGGIELPVGGDIITGANGQPIRSWDDLLSIIAFQQAGDTIELTVLRDGQEGVVQVQLGSRPNNPNQQQLP